MSIARMIVKSTMLEKKKIWKWVEKSTRFRKKKLSKKWIGKIRNYTQRF